MWDTVLFKERHFTTDLEQLRSSVNTKSHQTVPGFFAEYVPNISPSGLRVFTLSFFTKETGVAQIALLSSFAKLMNNYDESTVETAES